MCEHNDGYEGLGHCYYCRQVNPRGSNGSIPFRTTRELIADSETFLRLIADTADTETFLKLIADPEAFKDKILSDRSDQEDSHPSRSSETAPAKDPASKN